MYPSVIAGRADHARLKLSEGDFVRQVADVQLGIVMAAGIRAVNEGPRIYPRLRIFESGTGLSCSKRFGIVQGMRP